MVKKKSQKATVSSVARKTAANTSSSPETQQKRCVALEKARAARHANIEARDKWLNDRYPWWNEFMVQTDNGRIKIIPSACHIGEDFNGTFIAPEFNQYSVKRSFKGVDSAEKERKYMETRSRKLKEARGFTSDFLASHFGEKMMNEANVNDEAELEAYIVDFFRYFKISDVNREYKKYLEESKMAEANEEKEAQCEYGKSFFEGKGKWEIIRTLSRLNSTSISPGFEGGIIRRIEMIESLFYDNRLRTKTRPKKNGGTAFMVIDTKTNTEYWIGEEAYNYANHLLNEGGSARKECDFALHNDRDTSVAFVKDELRKKSAMDGTEEDGGVTDGNDTDDDGNPLPF